MVEDAVARLGGIDVLVNNAGIGGPTKPLHELDPADWDAVLRVNLTGAFDVARLVIPHMIAAGGGTIINMSSAAGRFGYANRTPYSARRDRVRAAISAHRRRSRAPSTMRWRRSVSR